MKPPTAAARVLMLPSSSENASRFLEITRSRLYGPLYDYFDVVLLFAPGIDQLHSLAQHTVNVLGADSL